MRGWPKTGARAILSTRQKKTQVPARFFYTGGFFGWWILGFLETRAFSAFFGVLSADFR